MLTRDCHTHPNLLKRPAQAVEFIEKAISVGLREIVFTDHMPFTFTGDEVDRIPFGAVGEYCREVKKLRDIYADRISVKTGIEIDFHPISMDEINDVLSAGEFDMVLCSSHLHIAAYGNDFTKLTKSEYASLVIENSLHGVETGLFDVVTHLDVYRWIFSFDNFACLEDRVHMEKLEPKLRRLFAAMEKRGVALELNAAPYYKGFDNLGVYPSEKIRKIAAEYKLRYTYGSDAHFVCHVGYARDEIGKLISKTV